MTGTGDIFRHYAPPKEVQSNYLNLMTQCVNVQPKNVRFIENSQVVDLLKSVVQNHKRCVFFANRISRIMDIFSDKSLPRNKMVVSFSDDEKRKDLKDKDNQAWIDMEETEESIRTDNKIPERFSVFLTTSRYREVINIHDDIDVMIVESHNKSEAIQMAGRVRSGVTDLYLVTNAQPYPTDFEEEELEWLIDSYQIDFSEVSI